MPKTEFKAMHHDGGEVSPRERVLRTATRLFYTNGVHSVGIDRIIAESGVAKMTFYRHFPSKARLVAEYLAQMEDGWQELISRFTADPSKTPLENLLGMFDALELSIKSPDFRGCPFIKGLAEFGPEHNEPEVRAHITAHFNRIEKVLVPLLKQIRPRASKKLLQPLMSLITGTVVVAQATGQTDVASRNKAFARTLLTQTAI
jgi:AcrR family transcriptional regulator